VGVSPRIAVALIAVAGACGSPAGQPGGDGGAGDDGGASGDAAGIGDGGNPVNDPLGTDTGCAGVFNPDQMLELGFDVAPGDWAAILADTTYALTVTAQMHCADETLTVGLRRKRSGGAMKVGLKVDVDYLVAGQRFHGLKKLSLENGVSSGDNSDGADVRDYLAEYLSWRLMGGAGATASRAAFVLVRVNGALVGVYVNVEQPDKRFLLSRFGENDGWLYKKSGGVNDGFKTHELDGLADPYADWFCFWGTPNGCPAPTSGQLATELPGHLAIDQMLRVGAVNAVIANTDGIFFKDNNYYWYDRPAGRVYLPWDLDTVMKADTDVFSGGGGGGTTAYSDVLFSNWRDDYRAILVDLLAGPLRLDTISTELDRAEAVAGAGFAADPYVTGSAAGAAAALHDWWAQRLPAVEGQLAP